MIKKIKKNSLKIFILSLYKRRMAKEFSGKNNKESKLWKVACYFSVFLFIFLLGFIVLIYFYPCFFNKINFLNLGYCGIKNDLLHDSNNCENCIQRFIDGVYVNPGMENLYPVAVIIDNHPDARPPFGLSKANLVYESEVEGRITRYMAVFAGGEEISKIGPVRSARPYSVDLVHELSALFVHCGGSPEALVKIDKDGIFDFNEFYQGSYFWRDKDKNAPHNIFISSNNLYEYLDNKNFRNGKFLSWKFNEKEIKKDNPSNFEIAIDFQSSNFSIIWKYDIINNEYIRYLGGELHEDADGEKITAKNIIIQYIGSEIIDDKLRLKMDVVGSGDALVCLGGECIKGGWEKSSSASRTRYYIENNEVIFNPGKTWVEIVNPEYSVDY